MKKFLYIILIIILCCVLAFFLVWINKANITAHFLSKEFHTDVTIENMGYKPGKWFIHDLHIQNPPRSKNNTAFLSEKIEIDAQLKKVFGPVMTIDKIDVLKITLGIELYNKEGTKNNWSKILFSPDEKVDYKHSNNTPKKKTSNKKYLIKNLTLRNITIILTDSTGKTKTLGPIKKMEFKNISDESGLPISELEDVIFKMILKSVIIEFSLENLFKLTDPSNLIPAIQNVIPSLSGS